MGTPHHDEPFLILACLALSPRAAAVAGESIRLARELAARVFFVHAGEDTPETRAAVEEVLRSQVTDGAELPEFTIREGAPHEVISAVAEELDPGLVLAGALEREGLLEGLFGSVARRIVRKVPRSVLLLTDPVREGHPFERIVLNVQLDAATAKMLEFAIPFARRAGARSLHFAYEGDCFDRFAGRVHASEGEEGEGDQDLMHATQLVRLRTFIEGYDFAGLEVDAEVLDGAEGLETVDYAHRVGADLLIYPAPCRPLGWWDRLLKHPTEAVMERLPCSVLLHRDHIEDDGED